ncbi:MAG: hypothetical protein WBW81_12420 [Methylocella sp.]
MTVGRIVGILFFSSLAATGATPAGGVPKGPGIKPTHPLPTIGAGIKPGHPLLMSGPGSARPARPQAPIVMGRSVSAHHKTKLHHIKMQPLESIETPVSADNSR